MQGFWTNGRVEILKAEWLGATAEYIADLIGEGCTRCSVIGKAYRLGLPKKHAGQITKKFWAEMSPTERRRRGYQIALAMELSHAQRKAAIVAAGIREPVPLFLSLFDLKATSCRWPYGDTPMTTFCGELLRAQRTKERVARHMVAAE